MKFAIPLHYEISFAGVTLLFFYLKTGISIGKITQNGGAHGLNPKVTPQLSPGQNDTHLAQNAFIFSVLQVQFFLVNKFKI